MADAHLALQGKATLKMQVNRLGIRMETCIGVVRSCGPWVPALVSPQSSLRRLRKLVCARRRPHCTRPGHEVFRVPAERARLVRASEEPGPRGTRSADLVACVTKPNGDCALIYVFDNRAASKALRTASLLLPAHTASPRAMTI
jgi:hypothetical protein